MRLVADPGFRPPRALRTGPVREFRFAEQSLGELFRGYIEENQQ